MSYMCTLYIYMYICIYIYSIPYVYSICMYIYIYVYIYTYTYTSVNPNISILGSDEAECSGAELSGAVTAFSNSFFEQFSRGKWAGVELS